LQAHGDGDQAGQDIGQSRLRPGQLMPEVIGVPQEYASDDGQAFQTQYHGGDGTQLGAAANLDHRGRAEDPEHEGQHGPTMTNRLHWVRKGDIRSQVDTIATRIGSVDVIERQKTECVYEPCDSAGQ
jgi:hypothetical protein